MKGNAGSLRLGALRAGGLMTQADVVNNPVPPALLSRLIGRPTQWKPTRRELLDSKRRQRHMSEAPTAELYTHGYLDKTRSSWMRINKKREGGGDREELPRKASWIRKREKMKSHRVVLLYIPHEQDYRKV
ncbi:hypothetical protein E5288_WYG005853 [Bos mutus]|uniref:Uncharacterized protein n=1 Tax=Bos mutus TaxID=72004 RepID=A0A6B0R0L5_9CETA|nr:hypothetical protein [Bos mutus]